MKLKDYLEIVFKAVVIVALAVIVMEQMNFDKALAYVDSERLVSEYKGIAAARQEFDIKTSALKANLDTLKIELEGEIEKYQIEKSSLSKNEVLRMEELLQTKQQIYLNYQAMVKEKMTEANTQLTQRVMTELNDFMKVYGREKGFKIIMSSNVIYADNALDITEEVLKGLNDTE